MASKTQRAFIRKSKPAIGEKLDKKLKAYSVAAGAAGVGLLALAQPAQAEIVYTPAHIRFMTTASRSIDMTHNGINEFRFVDAADLGSGSTTFVFAVGLHGGDGLLVRPNIVGKEAWPLPLGARIGPSELFSNSAAMAAAYHGSGGGTWGKNRYLGLKFQLNGQEHYGWAELSIGLNRKGTISVEINGYAYETVANKPILAGKTKQEDTALQQPTPASQHTSPPFSATLGLLALGSPGLSIWRRDLNP